MSATFHTFTSLQSFIFVLRTHYKLVTGAPVSLDSDELALQGDIYFPINYLE